jgi:hypothetical protein
MSADSEPSGKTRVHVIYPVTSVLIQKAEAAGQTPQECLTAMLTRESAFLGGALIDPANRKADGPNAAE